VIVRIAARVCCAVSVPRFPSASTLIDASMTATPSSPITNPVFAGAGALDLEFEIAAQTFGASSFSVNDGSVDFGALVARHAPRTTREDARTRNTRAFIVRLHF
jgi:hypothetical protein